MPEWITDNAIIPVMTGFLVSGILGAFAFMLQNRKLALLAGLAGIAALGLIVAERYIVTDRETVQRLVYKVANAVEFNRHDEVLSHIKPDSKAYAQAKTEMPNYTFRLCNIAGVRSLELNDDASPPTASITFVVYVDVNAPSYGHDGLARREVTLWMEKQADESWIIVGYSHRHPMGDARL